MGEKMEKRCPPIFLPDVVGWRKAPVLIPERYTEVLLKPPKVSYQFPRAPGILVWLDFQLPGAFRGAAVVPFRIHRKGITVPAEMVHSHEPYYAKELESHADA
jgi:hypothetical protein